MQTSKGNYDQAIMDAVSQTPMGSHGIEWNVVFRRLVALDVPLSLRQAQNRYHYLMWMERSNGVRKRGMVQCDVCHRPFKRSGIKLHQSKTGHHRQNGAAPTPAMMEASEGLDQRVASMIDKIRSIVDENDQLKQQVRGFEQAWNRMVQTLPKIKQAVSLLDEVISVAQL